MGDEGFRILEVDLTDRSTSEFFVDEATRRKYLGGSGLGAKLFFERRKYLVDPLGPDNDIFVMTGPLAGSALAGSSRFAVCARSPQTGIWGEGSCGGNFAPVLRQAGWHGIIIKGASDRPCMLVIEDGKIEVRDAQEYWGLDIYEINAKIKDEWPGKRRPSVLSIGQAGENLVKFACIANGDHDFVGRTGMGAVMGAKQLKAVVCVGTGKVALADPEGHKALRKELNAKIAEGVPAQSLKEMGTASGIDLGMMLGDLPIRNWRRGEDYEMSGALGGPAMCDSYLVKGTACHACPIASKRVVEVPDGPYKTAKGPGPEFETVCAFGTMLDHQNLAAVVKANEWCNRYGVDSITCGSTIAFAYDCFTEGLIDEQDTDGIKLEFGDPDAAIALVHKIAKREGFGDVLAEGSRSAAKKIGKGSEALTAEIKGLEIPMHDPRGSHGLGLAYMTSYRGACHKAHLAEAIEHGFQEYLGVGLKENYEGPSSEGKGRMVRISEDLGVPLNALALCEFEVWCFQFDDVVRSVQVCTGWDFTLEEYMAAGQRLWLLKRGLNNLMGVTRADDRMPQKILTPTPDGAVEGIVPDVELMLGEYYEERGLEDDGRPQRAVLEQAGLEDLAQVLYESA